MATIEKQQAVLQLARAVEAAGPDDLREVYYELFPEARAVDAEMSERAILLSRIKARFAEGLLGEEVLDLWNMTFPESRGDWYDEQDDTIHYQENGDAVAHTD